MQQKPLSVAQQVAQDVQTAEDIMAVLLARPHKPSNMSVSVMSEHVVPAEPQKATAPPQKKYRTVPGRLIRTVTTVKMDRCARCDNPSCTCRPRRIVIADGMVVVAQMVSFEPID